MESIKFIFNRILKFLNLSDRGGNLSITNIAVIVLITKIALAPTVDWQAAGALMVALLNYAHKRKESAQAEAELNKVSEYVDVKDQVSKAVEKVESLAKLHETVAKQAEDTKSMLSKSNLSGAFVPRRNRE